MKTINRVAKPCGIVGGIWAVLLSIILTLIFPARTFTQKIIEGQSWTFRTSVAESWAWGVLTIIILMALMGLLGLLAVILTRRIYQLSRIFIWVSALATLLISLVSMVTMASVGIILLPATILLILAAIGMGKKEEAVPVEAT
jgi:hypothetical protein